MSNHHAKAVFSADDTSVQAVMDRMDRKLTHLEHGFHHFGEVAEKALALTGAAVLLEHGFEAFHAVLEKGHHLEVFAAKTGGAVDELVVLEAMFHRVGGGAEQAEKLIGHMQKTLASGEQNHLLTQMGLDPEELRRAGAVEGVQKIGHALLQIPNAGDRAAASIALLGKSGREVLAVFSMGHVDEMLANAHRQAEIYEHSAGTFSLVHEKMDGVGDRIRTSWLILADRIADTLLPLLDKVNAALDRFNRDDGPVAAAGSVGGQMLEDLDKDDQSFMDDAVELMVDGLQQIMVDAAQNFGFNTDGWQDDTVVSRAANRQIQKEHDRDIKEEQERLAKFAKEEEDPALLDFGHGRGGVTALGRVGGNWGGGGVDPWLDEARQHTRLLETIAANTAHAPKHAAGSAVAAYAGTYAH